MKTEDSQNAPQSEEVLTRLSTSIADAVGLKLKEIMSDLAARHFSPAPPPIGPEWARQSSVSIANAVGSKLEDSLMEITSDLAARHFPCAPPLITPGKTSTFIPHSSRLQDRPEIADVVASAGSTYATTLILTCASLSGALYRSSPTDNEQDRFRGRAQQTFAMVPRSYQQQSPQIRAAALSTPITRSLPTPTPFTSRPAWINAATEPSEDRTRAELYKNMGYVNLGLEWIRDLCWCCWARGYSCDDHNHMQCGEDLVGNDDQKWRGFSRTIVLQKGWCFFCTIPQVRLFALFKLAQLIDDPLEWKAKGMAQVGRGKHCKL
jgi:hypothetical protein